MAVMLELRRRVTPASYAPKRKIDCTRLWQFEFTASELVQLCAKLGV